MPYWFSGFLLVTYDMNSCLEIILLYGMSGCCQPKFIQDYFHNSISFWVLCIQCIRWTLSISFSFTLVTVAMPHSGTFNGYRYFTVIDLAFWMSLDVSSVWQKTNSIIGMSTVCSTPCWDNKENMKAPRYWSPVREICCDTPEQLREVKIACHCPDRASMPHPFLHEKRDNKSHVPKRVSVWSIFVY